MATGDEADQHPLDHRVLPDDHALDLEQGALEPRGVRAAVAMGLCTLGLGLHDMPLVGVWGQVPRRRTAGAGTAPVHRAQAKTTGNAGESRAKACVRAVAAAPIVRSMRMLVVEDEEGLASALRIGLGREGYAVDLAGTRTEAVAKLAVSAYDVLLLDVSLPDGSGLALARDVRAGTVDTPAPTPAS